MIERIESNDERITLTEEQVADICLVSGRTHPALAEETAKHMGVELDPMDLRDHPNTENYARYLNSIRGRHVFILQTHAPTGDHSVWDSIGENLVMTDAAKRASASQITSVNPMFGFSRQDRKAKGREPISAKLLVDVLTAAGADRIVSVDLHSPQIQGFLDGPFDPMAAEPVLLEALQSEMGDTDPKEFVMVSPDAGRAKLMEDYSIALGTGSVMIVKRRDPENSQKLIMPDWIDGVDGKICLVGDDMIDTAGTLVKAAEVLKKSGAKTIKVAATHGFFSKDAVTKIDDSPIEKIIVTNTIPTAHAETVLGDKLKVVSIAPLLGDTIIRVALNLSVSEIYHGRNYM